MTSGWSRSAADRLRRRPGSNPRANPDGAERALEDIPKLIRSCTRPYPFEETPLGGLVTGDIDGDVGATSRRVLGQLEGRSGKPSSPAGWAGQAADVTDNRQRVEWLMRGTAGMALRLVARHERAGIVEVTVTLSDDGHP